MTSTPPGAEVTINNRTVGVTPVRVGYSHYGWYEIVLRKDRYKTAVRRQNLIAPFYAYDPISIVSDVIPARIVDEYLVHAVLEPIEESADAKQLLGRAEAAASGRPVLPDGSEAEVPEYSALLREKPGPRSERRPPRDPKEQPPKELPPDLREPKGIDEEPPDGPRLAPEPAPRKEDPKPRKPPIPKPADKRPAKSEILDTMDPPPMDKEGK